MATQSRFFAFLDRLKFINRWSLMRNIIPENVIEHSWGCATIAHMLAVIERELYDNDVNPTEVATAALYHDAAEFIGDIPTPVKYHSKTILNALKKIENEAERELLSLIPEQLQSHFSHVLIQENVDPSIKKIVKAADIISAYLKSKSECDAGNKDFEDARITLLNSVNSLELQSVKYFMATFTQRHHLTIDEIFGLSSKEGQIGL